MIAVLTVAGVLAEFLGLVLVFVGFQRTLRQTIPGEKLLRHVGRRSWDRLSALAVSVSARFGRTRRAQVHEVSGVATGQMRFSGRARGYSPLPPLADDPVAFAKAVDAKLMNLGGEIDELQAVVERDRHTSEVALHGLTNDVERRFHEQALAERVQVSSDLVIQVWGWLLVVLGLGLTGLASILQL